MKGLFYLSFLVVALAVLMAIVGVLEDGLSSGEGVVLGIAAFYMFVIVPVVKDSHPDWFEPGNY